MNTQWSDLPRRLTTICVGVPMLWIILSRDTLRYLFFQGTHIVVCLEWIGLSSSDPHQSFERMSFVIFSFVLSIICSNSAFLLCLVGSLATASIMNKATDTLVIGIFLVSIPFRAWCCNVSRDFELTVSLLFTVWNCDTGALVIGRLFKSLHRCPLPQPAWLQRISPSKSLAGLVGGVAFGTLTYLVLPVFWYWIYENSLAQRGDQSTVYYHHWFIDGLGKGFLLSTTAILGDLWESSLKRKFSVKDSGKLLPGHGGVLDRFDSSLIAVMVYPYLIESV